MKLRNRNTIKATLALAGTLAALGVQAQTPRLTVAMYGGNWGDAFRSCVAEPFTKATGIAVTPELGTSTTTLAKLQQQKNAPSVDVAWMDGGISELAYQAGVVDNLDAAALPNLKNMLPQAVYRNGATTYAVSSGYYSLGLTYSTKAVKTVPTSWKDLWNPAYAGAVTVPSPANSAGVPFVVFLAQVWGVNPASLEPVYAKLAALDTALFFDSSGAASNAFQSGEAVIGAHFNVGAWDLIDKGVPLGFVVPKEGAWATDARLHLVKGSRNKAAAEQFINSALTPAAATCLATKLYLGPAVAGVTLPAEVSRKLPWGASGSVNSLKLFDWSAINARRAEITAAWNRQVANKR
ncbi:ABC transporter substrate-binding protein [Paraburkholderia bonniea]|uniref:ABC transporter substrate-binding protein n=1 Tax=Paraburkholderia bonniea TaxID=2152891 RepID=UPI001290AE5E|nr:ABC transporter substrate-binding protein [Paraburkholderia bonniea]WJF89170.1 ABC transporter substrate-binding protein [Paraburkholderia bonniea]WJF92486.1 ABC transporter substrate-binding protein [Paraburkholderia bonniea]